MKLYIDKENLLSFIKSNTNDLFDDCSRLIKRELDVQFNFSREDSRSNEYLQAWFAHFGEGIIGKQSFVPDDTREIIPPRPLKSNFLNMTSKDGLKSIYLLNDNHMCDVVKNKSCIMIGKIGEEIEVLSSLILDDSEKATHEIMSWDDYCPTLPLTDIILCDNHYFKHKDIYEKNNNELIRCLASIPNGSPINVIIFTKTGEIDKSIDLNQEQKTLKTIVKKESGSNKSTVTIVVSYATHDRNLITNYYRIKTGSCVHLKYNHIKKDVTTEIKSHANRNNEKISKKLIKAFQGIINENPVCYGDKVSNFITF